MMHINSLGFRGPELPASLSDKRLVLAIGESTTFGWGMRDEESYPSQLEALLNAPSDDRRWVVVNAGVPSYSSRQVCLYADELLTRFHPDVVLVNNLWNDVFYSSLEDWTPQTLIPRYPSKPEQILLTYSNVYRWLAMTPDQPEMVNFYVTNALVEYRANLAKILRLCKSKQITVAFVEPPYCHGRIPQAGIAMWKNRFSKKFLLRLAQMFLEVQMDEAKAHRVGVIRHQLGVWEHSTPDHFVDFIHTDGEGNRMIAQSVADYFESHLPEGVTK
jgi:lysophospholipase L1-like esterase